LIRHLPRLAALGAVEIVPAGSFKAEPFFYRRSIHHPHSRNALSTWWRRSLCGIPATRPSKSLRKKAFVH
jgi:hypothetical protein